MHLIANVFATFSLFLMSILGGHTVHTTPVPQPTTQGVFQNQNGYANESAGSQPDSSFVALMQQIGCTDQSSCIAACMQSHSQACQDLQYIMARQISQGRSFAGYTTGSPMGGRSSDVAAVGNNINATAGALPACPTSNAILTQSPIAVGDLAGIEPLGHMNAEHILPNQADHVYLQAKSTASTPVVAPANVTVLGIAKTTGIAGEDTGANTVKLFFSTCKSVMFALQINTLSPQIEKEIASVQPSNVQKGATVENIVYGPLDISVPAGEELGTVVGMNGRGGEADFAATDMRTAPLQFIDQSEQTGMLADSYAHAVCPLDYFGSLKSTLYSLLTMQNVGTNGIPACGAVMQDKATTAQGNWYHKGDTTFYQGIDEASLLAIVHSNLNPAQGVVSVGTDLIPNQRLGTQLIFTPQHSGNINREPSEVTADGQVYCFDGTGGNGDKMHIDIKLTNATTLLADYSSDDCSATPTLSSHTITYER